MERQSGKAQQYQTPPRKDKALFEDQKATRIQSYIQSNIKKPSFVYTPSTGQLTQNQNTILMSQLDPSKNKTFYQAHMNTQNRKQKSIKTSNNQYLDDKIKIRLFQENTAKKNVKGSQSTKDQKPIFYIATSKSTSKKGLSLIKNLIIQSPSKSKQKQQSSFQQPLQKQDITNAKINITSTNLQTKQKELNRKKNDDSKDQRLSQFSSIKKSDFFLQFIQREVQSCYCKQFFIKIYGKVLTDWKVNKFAFGLIMLELGLISDLVKERHFVQKTWFQICLLISHPSAENIQMGILFAFITSVMGYAMEEINLFNYLESLYCGKSSPSLKFQKQVYNYFKGKKMMFNIKRLSNPKKV